MKKTLLILGLILSFAFLYAQRGGDVSHRQRVAPTGDITEIPQILLSNPKGDNSDLYYGFGTTTVSYRTTVSGNFPGTQLGSAGTNMQATEYINGTWYAVSYGSYGNHFGTINLQNGSFNVIKNGFANDAMSLCYNPTNGLTYAFAWGGGSFGTVNLATGDYNAIGNTGNQAIYAAIDNLGDCYYIRFAAGNPTPFGKVNLATGQLTQLGTIPFQTNYIQSLCIDRETNELYWFAVNYTAGSYHFYKVNKTNGALTEVKSLTGIVEGNVSASGIATNTVNCEPATNVAYKVLGNDVRLTWEAPAGATPTGYRIDYNGAPLVTLGADVFTYVHTGVSEGLQQYTITALSIAGCIPLGVPVSVVVGDFCYIRLDMEDLVVDDPETGKYYGWLDAQIEVYHNGVLCGIGTVPVDANTSTEFILVPAGEIEFYWTPYQNGEWDDECAFKIYNSFGDLIYETDPNDNMQNYLYDMFFSYPNTCKTCLPPTNFTVNFTSDCAAELKWTAPSGTGSFNIYRNFVLIDNVTGTSYTDIGFDHLTTNTWAVEFVCASDNISLAATKSSICTAIKDNTGVSTFSIVPNPANNQIEITSMGNFNTVEVINFLGQTVISQPNINSNNVTLDISTLNNGIYFVRLISENGATVKKFIKQ